MALRRRFLFVVFAILTLLFLSFSPISRSQCATCRDERLALILKSTGRSSFFGRRKFSWRSLPQRHAVDEVRPLPTGPYGRIPKIQHEFGPETQEQKLKKLKRLAAVKEALLHSWHGYKRYAWLHDEVAPVSGKVNNGYGGWATTLVDSLDTLWIMGLEKEFKRGLKELRKIDFSMTLADEINIFETTIRHVGGLLSAYDISGQQFPILLEKAMELGDMLYHAFDTPNRMPVTRWDWKNTALGGFQESSTVSLLAEVGSLSLEFTRLSQLTGDSKWYDAIARITDAFQEQQNKTKIPGLFPRKINTRQKDFRADIVFTLGGMADSLYEYLPKQHLLLGGQSDQYRDMYNNALRAAKEHLFFQPLNPDNQSLLIPGTLRRHSAVRIEFLTEGEHLTCFSGGMVALAARAFEQPQDLEVARQLLDGCIWAYNSMPTGIMPEAFVVASCDQLNCSWSEGQWHEAVAKHSGQHSPARDVAQKVIMEKELAPGFLDIPDSRYLLRPEAIESLFVLYRVTGDRDLQEKAWNMFRSINRVAKTDIAYAGIADVREAHHVQLLDTMESFWTAETLKYFYLIFSEPSVVSLDKYVLNTEAHPLLRPT
ncbi:glycoside hydrolase family 47 protein [Piedraia hortae CBS 480.64]|uniref:alpha-1,2-Mannosidase n=1 Tax=Piedraia hortae CBS 480.64 TaxID=1314780 RepID=A0A6A7C465_9PEZI|nr:glycoside hydrolase family 47 protein [Piedraia hortae CBS 480.64]